MYHYTDWVYDQHNTYFELCSERYRNHKFRMCYRYGLRCVFNDHSKFNDLVFLINFSSKKVAKQIFKIMAVKIREARNDIYDQEMHRYIYTPVPPEQVLNLFIETINSSEIIGKRTKDRVLKQLFENV